MPIYDYVCSACQHRTEVIHGIHQPGPRFCPACGAEGTLRKGITSPAFLFKGSGWAKKDRATSAHRATKAAAKRDAAGSSNAETSSASEKASSDSTSPGSSATEMGTASAGPKAPAPTGGD